MDRFALNCLSSGEILELLYCIRKSLTSRCDYLHEKMRIWPGISHTSCSCKIERQLNSSILQVPVMRPHLLVRSGNTAKNQFGSLGPLNDSDSPSKRSTDMFVQSARLKFQLPRQSAKQHNLHPANYHYYYCRYISGYIYPHSRTLAADLTFCYYP